MPITVPWCESLVAGFNLLIYDFFMPEANLVGRRLKIPAVCSIPAFMGPHQKSYLDSWLEPHQKLLLELKSRFGVDLKKEMESASDLLCIQAD